MKKSLLITGIILILIIFITIVLLNTTMILKNNKDKNMDLNITTNSTNNTKKNFSSDKESNESDVQISEGGEGTDSDDADTENNLPDDLDERACGFYTKEYDVCEGYCPEGECVKEGKSCYCKET